MEKTCSGITRKGRRNRGRRAPRYQSVEAPKPPKLHTPEDAVLQRAHNLLFTGYAACSLEERIRIVRKQDAMLREAEE